MGLSNEERLSGMYYAARSMVEHGRALKATKTLSFEDEFKVLPELTERIWVTIFGSRSNGVHWLLGSSATNAMQSIPATPWEVALTEHASSFVRAPNPLRKDPELFDAVEFCDIPHILRQYGRPELAAAYDIYKWSEQMSYYLRRYSDDFLEKYQDLSDLIAKIDGECFTIFSKHEEFAKAYLHHQILSKLYTPQHPWNNDPLAALMVKECLHHYLVPRHVDGKQLAKWHIRLLKASDSKMVETRVRVMAEVLTKSSSDSSKPTLLLRSMAADEHLKQFVPMVTSILSKIKGSKSKNPYEPDPFAKFRVYGSEAYSIAEPYRRYRPKKVKPLVKAKSSKTKTKRTKKGKS